MGRSHDLVAVTVESSLGAPAATVWSTVSTMDGINAELQPWLKMTVPPEIGSQQLGSWVVSASRESSKRPGSWILLLGVIPIDRHRFRIEDVIEGPATWGFDEESTTWLQRRWRHERRVESVGDATCKVIDTVVVVPRLRFARSMVGPIVNRVFQHRHRRLLARFGSPAGARRN